MIKVLHVDNTDSTNKYRELFSENLYNIRASYSWYFLTSHKLQIDGLQQNNNKFYTFSRVAS